ncbi:YIP1 family protein [Candidatus Galacturonibacter soehngenii]|uniref:YIP1 family protein n=1 Tax=Candidatus Galacturonatibacter soehngenii TaxID=2307010 RepID=A0A7V7QLX5_9FIRM|nr:YIP1 family protein [Candidatus Galacturonibacter soehngenii]KAB1439604.1 YIP1 family protein [Candidatus Galacturonibacter soehngenii]
MQVSLKKKETYGHYFATLRYAMYVITHPLDGFWDLTHENRGSLAAANTIIILTLLVRIMKLQFTSFLFLQVYWEGINIFLYIASILFPLVLFCVGNWGLTTLFDGKGKLSQIYMGTAYALTPYPLIQFFMILFSNVVTDEEGAFYYFAAALSVGWVAMLIICAMMEIHEYTLSKTILFIIATFFAMMVMVFLLMLFFSMTSQGIAYFISIVKEIMFRM